MRLIDADALDDKAKQYSLGYYEADEWAVPLEDIDDAPTIDVVSVEWIPCDERLPSENGYYLCCNKGYLPYVGHFLDGRWIDFDGTIMHADAWMPLPEPWKGADDEVR